MKHEGSAPIPNPQGLFCVFKSVRLFSYLISFLAIGICFLGIGAFNQTLATNYYVDSSITDTNPASGTPDCTNYNTGTFVCSGGSASAYKTIADINAGSFSGDDQILFRKGQTWRETLTVPSSGTSGHPITFGAFGSGAKPVITGADVMNGFSDGGSNIWDKTGVTTQPYVVSFSGTVGTLASSRADCNAPGKWYWTGNTLSVYATSDPSGTIEASQRNTNVYVQSKDYITIENLELIYANDSGIYLKDAKYDTVQNSTIHDHHNHGIYMFLNNSGGHLIQNNTIYDTGINRVAGGDGSALMTDVTVTIPSTIQNNYIYNVYGDNHDHGYYSQTIGNDIIRFNYFKNVAGFGVKVDTGPANAQVYYNIFETCAAAGVAILGGAGASVYNNTIYNSGVWPTGTSPYAGIWYSYSSQAGTAVVKNNIIIGAGAGLEVDPTTGFTSDYNLIYGGVNIGDWGGNLYNTLSDWKTNSGQDAHSISSDPYLVAGGDAKPYPYFYPRYYFPVINAGTDVGLTSDYLGVSVPQAAAPDIGAFEYTVSVPENIWFLFPLFMALPRLIFLLGNRQGRKLLLSLIGKHEYISVVKELYLPYLNLVFSLTKRSN